MKKKITLIIAIITFIVSLVAVTLFYYHNTSNQEELLEEASSLGIIKITDDNFQEEVMKSDKIVVLYFFENMCPPCTTMIPTIINISKSSDDVKVVMINTSDDNTNKLKTKYEVTATPTIYILKNGELIKGFIGATSENTIMQIINSELELKNEK